MEILGVLLGITMCAVAWSVKESRDHRKLIIEIQNKVIFDLQSRITALEKRRPVVTEMTGALEMKDTYRSGRAAMRTWNENIGAAEAK